MSDILEINIPGAHPPSVNHVWKHASIHGKQRTYMTKEGKDFKELIQRNIPGSHVPFKGELSVEIVLTWPNNLRRDIDNYSKTILDGLNKYAFEDDSQIVELLIRKAVSKEDPGIYIKIGKI